MNVLNMQGLSTDKVINPLGQLGVVNQQEKLAQDLRTLILTRQGSVLGNPLYGSRLHEILFDTSSEETLALAESEVKTIIESNYNLIHNVKVKCTVKDKTLHMIVSYSTLNSELSTNLEFDIPLDTRGGNTYE